VQAALAGADVALIELFDRAARAMSDSSRMSG